jgi:hypothetical protein
LKQEIRYFLEEKFPRIRRLAKNINAEIAFEDETGVGVSTRYGRTWGERGKAPEVPATDQRGKYNVLSTVSAQGILRYSATEENINSQRFIGFLKQLLQGRARSLILLLDRASFHGSKLVRDFVRAHRTQIRIYFLPRHAPEYNPDEQVWGEIKVNRIGILHWLLCSTKPNESALSFNFQIPSMRQIYVWILMSSTI